MPHPEAIPDHLLRRAADINKPPARDTYGKTPLMQMMETTAQLLPRHDSSSLYDQLRHRGIEPVESKPSLAEEVAKLRETVEELVYWVRPQMGQIITGKAAVEEFERLTGRKL